MTRKELLERFEKDNKYFEICDMKNDKNIEKYFDFIERERKAGIILY